MPIWCKLKKGKIFENMFQFPFRILKMLLVSLGSCLILENLLTALQFQKKIQKSCWIYFCFDNDRNQAMPIRLVLDWDFKERLKEFLEFYSFFGSDWDFKQRLKEFFGIWLHFFKGQ